LACQTVASSQRINFRCFYIYPLKNEKLFGKNQLLALKSWWHTVWHIRYAGNSIKFNLTQKTLFMHNIDRTVDEMEYAGEFEQYPGHSYETAQGEMFENEYGNEHEYAGENEGVYEDEGEFQGEEHEYDHEDEYSDHEVNEMELATELLSVNSEEELEEFLGGLFKRVKGLASKVLKSPAGNMLKGYLKTLAKKALPIAGSALGGIVGGPVGAALAGKATDMVGKALGLELEGLSPEDREFEIAKGYVRFANDAVRRVATDRRYRNQPRTAARNAMVNAARKHAPGFLSPHFYRRYRSVAGSRAGTEESGTWERQPDGTIVLYGL
jgi:hypothetical protein